MKKTNVYHGKFKLHHVEKIIRVMKIASFLLLLAFVQVSAASYSQATKLNLNYQNVKLSDLLDKIEKASDYRFFYDSRSVDLSKAVSVDFQDSNLKDVLNKVLGSDFIYEMVSNNIIVIKSVKNSDVDASVSQQQSRTISGRVTDASGAPLPGVTVVVKGTTNGTITGSDGKYTISNAPSDATLLFSFVGMKTQEISVSGKTAIDVVLTEETIGIEEVVAIGYGTQKKSDVTGAIASISQKALKDVPVTNAQQMLQGKVSGVSVVKTGNRPGDGVSVLIRGRRSFNAGNDPLYVIDGVPLSGGFNDINPNDIESMDVLKDASATAIYGSRGANGVIIITTKRGKQGKTSVDYSAYFGVTNIIKYLDVMNGEEFAEYKRESRRAIGQYNDSDPLADSKIFDATELESIAKGRSTDYQRLMINPGQSQNHDLSVMGGSENTKFNISLGYFDDIGIIHGQDFTRYSIRVNVDQKISDRFKVGVSSFGSLSQRNGMDINPYGGVNYGAITSNPLGAPYDANGNINFQLTSDGVKSNPLSELVPGAVINRNKRVRILNNIYGEAKIIDGLVFRMNFSPDVAQSRTGNFNGKYTAARFLGDPSASSNEGLSVSYTWENIMSYKKLIAKKHNIDFTGLYSIQTEQSEGTSINVVGVPVEAMEYYNLGAASNINSVGSYFSKWTILSYMARINYSFDNRFLLTLSGRADGSSKFAKGNNWGYFPSAAAAWSVSNEKFLKNNETISNLKLRLSYGETGNQGINPYQTNGLLYRTAYDFDGVAAYGYQPNSIRNNSLKWESTASLNAGIDFGFFNNRITGTVEVYRSRTNDLLLPRLLPITSGFNSILSNVGKKQNKGIELSLSTINISKQSNGFEWRTDFNLFTNNEEILELSQGKVDDVGNLRFIGEPAVVYYDYVKTGIWQLGEDADAKKYSSRVGDIKIKDVNENGVIDPDDRQIIGSDVPKIIAGMTNRFEYKGFDLSVVTFGRFGNTIISPFHGPGLYYFLSGRSNQLKLDYWTKSNPTNAYPQPSAGFEFPYFASSLQYFDGSFVKIRNITMGYTFPSALVSKLKAQSLRIYLSAQDPFVFSSYTSKYGGLDPESPGVGTPPSRSLLFGLNIKF